MTVIVAHNYYQTPGGEDLVVEAETELLRARGHNVVKFEDHNARIAHLDRIQLARCTIWNGQACRRLEQMIRMTRADIVHFHNTFPLLSPSCYYAAKRAGAAVVQTLHNYRLLCPSAVMFREGRTCERCAGAGLAWPAILYGCYRASRSASLATACMLGIHRFLGTWTRIVDAYIALTKFARDKFVAYGIPAAKVHIKGNFLAHDPGLGAGNGRFALFVGRLVEEKGVGTLLDAWKLAPPDVPLKIVGEGPLEALVRQRAAALPNVSLLGRLDRAKVLRLLQDASYLIVPSLWYEGLPLTVVESFASGCPVVASDIGCLSSLIRNRVTGLLVAPGDARRLAAAIGWMSSHAEERRQMGLQARLEFIRCFTADQNYRSLIKIYQAALTEAGKLQPLPELIDATK